MRGRTRGMAAAASRPSLSLRRRVVVGVRGAEPGAEDPAGQAGGEIAIRSCTPQNPLIPANTNEQLWRQLLDAITGQARALQH